MREWMSYGASRVLLTDPTKALGAGRFTAEIVRLGFYEPKARRTVYQWKLNMWFGREGETTTYETLEAAKLAVEMML